MAVARGIRDGNQPSQQYRGPKGSRAMMIKNVKSNGFHEAGIGELLATAQIMYKNKENFGHLLVKCGGAQSIEVWGIAINVSYLNSSLCKIRPHEGFT